MRAARGAAIVWTMGCGSSEEPVLGRFEVVGSVLGGAVIDGPATAAAGSERSAAAPPSWGRESWVLERDRVVIKRELLFPATSGDGHVACEVSLRVEVAWTGGTMTIPYAARSRARATTASASPPTGPLACEVSAIPGEWRLTRTSGKRWDYELSSGDRTLRLALGGEQPDYASHLALPVGAP